MIFSLLRRWTGQRIGTKPCSNRSTRSTKQVRSTAIGRGHYFNQPLLWKTVHARRACLHLCACLFACQLLLNLKCQNRSKPELIRWEHEIVERRKNWVKPLIDSELSWEICSHFVGSAESHRRHKACLFRAAQAFFLPSHILIHMPWWWHWAGWNIFLCQIKESSHLKRKMQCSS